MIKKYSVVAERVQSLILAAGIDDAAWLGGDVVVFDLGDHAAIPLVCRLDVARFRAWLRGVACT